jgi:hypothetical protein
MVDGIAVERGYLYLAQAYDSEVADDEIIATLLSQVLFDADEPAWHAHLRPWKVNSVAVWYGLPGTERVYVAMSDEGEVEFLGPGGNPTLAEWIDGAGLSRPWSRGLGHLNKVRAIGVSLYAVGGANQVYQRSPDRKWTLVSGEILVDPDARRAGPDPMQAIRHLSDVLGFDESDIYVAGLMGEVHHFDGTRWNRIRTDTTKHLHVMCQAAKDDVFVGGAYGTLLRGNKDVGFRSVWPLVDEIYVTGIAVYDETLFIAAGTRGLYTLDLRTGAAAPYRSGLQPEFMDPHRLEARDGVLWCFGFKDLAVFDGATWRRIEHPDNPPIR